MSTLNQRVLLLRSTRGGKLGPLRSATVGRVMRRPALVFLAGLVATVAVGCGDSGLTKTAFLQKGNSICTAGTHKINSAGQHSFATPGRPTEAETVAFARRTVVPTVQSELDQLRALKPPKVDEQRVDEILNRSQAAVNLVKANPRLLGRETASEKANKLAKAYGLTACAG
jgi:hypothetical protein